MLLQFCFIVTVPIYEKEGGSIEQLKQVGLTFIDGIKVSQDEDSRVYTLTFPEDFSGNVLNIFEQIIRFIHSHPEDLSDFRLLSGGKPDLRLQVLEIFLRESIKLLAITSDPNEQAILKGFQKKKKGEDRAEHSRKLKAIETRNKEERRLAQAHEREAKERRKTESGKAVNGDTGSSVASMSPLAGDSREDMASHSSKGSAVVLSVDDWAALPSYLARKLQHFEREQVEWTTSRYLKFLSICSETVWLCDEKKQRIAAEYDIRKRREVRDHIETMESYSKHLFKKCFSLSVKEVAALATNWYEGKKEVCIEIRAGIEDYSRKLSSGGVAAIEAIEYAYKFYGYQKALGEILFGLRLFESLLGTHRRRVVQEAKDKVTELRQWVVDDMSLVPVREDSTDDCSSSIAPGNSSRRVSLTGGADGVLTSGLQQHVDQYYDILLSTPLGVLIHLVDRFWLITQIQNQTLRNIIILNGGQTERLRFDVVRLDEKIGEINACLLEERVSALLLLGIGLTAEDVREIEVEITDSKSFQGTEAFISSLLSNSRIPSNVAVVEDPPPPVQFVAVGDRPSFREDGGDVPSSESSAFSLIELWRQFDFARLLAGHLVSHITLYCKLSTPVDSDGASRDVSISTGATKKTNELLGKITASIIGHSPCLKEVCSRGLQGRKVISLVNVVVSEKEYTIIISLLKELRSLEEKLSNLPRFRSLYHVVSEAREIVNVVLFNCIRSSISCHPIRTFFEHHREQINFDVMCKVTWEQIGTFNGDVERKISRAELIRRLSNFGLEAVFKPGLRSSEDLRGVGRIVEGSGDGESSAEDEAVSASPPETPVAESAEAVSPPPSAADEAGAASSAVDVGKVAVLPSGVVAEGEIVDHPPSAAVAAPVEVDDESEIPIIDQLKAAIAWSKLTNSDLKDLLAPPVILKARRHTVREIEKLNQSSLELAQAFMILARLGVKFTDEQRLCIFNGLGLIRAGLTADKGAVHGFERGLAGGDLAGFDFGAMSRCTEGLEVRVKQVSADIKKLSSWQESVREKRIYPGLGRNTDLVLLRVIDQLSKYRGDLRALNNRLDVAQKVRSRVVLSEATDACPALVEFADLKVRLVTTSARMRRAVDVFDEKVFNVPHEADVSDRSFGMLDFVLEHVICFVSGYDDVMIRDKYLTARERLEAMQRGNPIEKDLATTGLLKGAHVENLVRDYGMYSTKIRGYCDSYHIGEIVDGGKKIGCYLREVNVGVVVESDALIAEFERTKQYMVSVRITRLTEAFVSATKEQLLIDLTARAEALRKKYHQVQLAKKFPGVELTCAQVADAIFSRSLRVFRNLDCSTLSQYKAEDPERTRSVHDCIQHSGKISFYVSEHVRANEQAAVAYWLTIAEELCAKKDFASFMGVISGLGLRDAHNITGEWLKKASPLAKTQLCEFKWLAANLLRAASLDLQKDAVVADIAAFRFALATKHESRQLFGTEGSSTVEIQVINLAKDCKARAAAQGVVSLTPDMSVLVKILDEVEVDYAKVFSDCYPGVKYRAIKGKFFLQWVCSRGGKPIVNLGNKIGQINEIVESAAEARTADLAKRLAEVLNEGLLEGEIKLTVPEEVAGDTKQEALFARINSKILQTLIGEKVGRVRSLRGRTFEMVDELNTALGQTNKEEAITLLKQLEGPVAGRGLSAADFGLDSDSLTSLLEIEGAVVKAISMSSSELDKPGFEVPELADIKAALGVVQRMYDEYLKVYGCLHRQGGIFLTKRNIDNFRFSADEAKQCIQRPLVASLDKRFILAGMEQKLRARMGELEKKAEEVKQRFMQDGHDVSEDLQKIADCSTAGCPTDGEIDRLELAWRVRFQYLSALPKCDDVLGKDLYSRLENADLNVRFFRALIHAINQLFANFRTLIDGEAENLRIQADFYSGATIFLAILISKGKIQDFSVCLAQFKKLKDKCCALVDFCREPVKLRVVAQQAIGILYKFFKTRVSGGRVDSSSPGVWSERHGANIVLFVEEMREQLSKAVITEDDLRTIMRLFGDLLFSFGPIEERLVGVAGVIENIIGWLTQVVIFVHGIDQKIKRLIPNLQSAEQDAKRKELLGELYDEMAIFAKQGMVLCGVTYPEGFCEQYITVPRLFNAEDPTKLRLMSLEDVLMRPMRMKLDAIFDVAMAGAEFSFITGLVQEEQYRQIGKLRQLYNSLTALRSDGFVPDGAGSVADADREELIDTIQRKIVELQAPPVLRAAVETPSHRSDEPPPSSAGAAASVVTAPVDIAGVRQRFDEICTEIVCGISEIEGGNDDYGKCEKLFSQRGAEAPAAGATEEVAVIPASPTTPAGRKRGQRRGVGWLLIELERLIESLQRTSDTQAQELKQEIKSALSEFQNNEVLKEKVPSFVRVLFCLEFAKRIPEILSPIDSSGRSNGFAGPRVLNHWESRLDEVHRLTSNQILRHSLEASRFISQKRPISTQYLFYIMQYRAFLAHTFCCDETGELRESIKSLFVSTAPRLDLKKVQRCLVDAFCTSAMDSVYAQKGASRYSIDYKSILDQLFQPLSSMHYLSDDISAEDFIDTPREKEKRFLELIVKQRFETTREMVQPNPLDVPLVKTVTERDRLYYRLKLLKEAEDFCRSLPPCEKDEFQKYVSAKRNEIIKERVAELYIDECTTMFRAFFDPAISDLPVSVILAQDTREQILAAVNEIDFDKFAECEVVICSLKPELQMQYQRLLRAMQLVRGDLRVENIETPEPVPVARCLYERAESMIDAARYVVTKYWNVDFSIAEQEKWFKDNIESIWRNVFSPSSSAQVVEIDFEDLMNKTVKQLHKYKVGMGGKESRDNVKDILIAADHLVQWERGRHTVTTVFEQNGMKYIQIERPVGGFTPKQILDYLHIFIAPTPPWFTELPDIIKCFLNDKLEKFKEAFINAENKQVFCETFASEFNATLNLPPPTLQGVPGVNSWEHILIVLGATGNEVFRSICLCSANVTQVLEPVLKDCVERLVAMRQALGSDDIPDRFEVPVLLQTLVSPAKLTGGDKSQTAKDSHDSVSPVKGKIPSVSDQVKVMICGKEVVITPVLLPANHSEAIYKALRCFLLGIKPIIDSKLSSSNELWRVLNLISDTIDVIEKGTRSSESSKDVLESCLNAASLRIAEEDLLQVRQIKLMCQAAYIGITLAKKESLSNWEGLTLAAVEQIVSSVAGVSWTSCENDPSYTAIVTMWADAMVRYSVEMSGYLPNLSTDGAARDTFAIYFADFLMSYHHQYIAEQTTSGVHWLKSIENALPDEVYIAIADRVLGIEVVAELRQDEKKLLNDADLTARLRKDQRMQNLANLVELNKIGGSNTKFRVSAIEIAEAKAAKDTKIAVKAGEKTKAAASSSVPAEVKSGEGCDYDGEQIDKLLQNLNGKDSKEDKGGTAVLISLPVATDVEQNVFIPLLQDLIIGHRQPTTVVCPLNIGTHEMPHWVALYMEVERNLKGDIRLLNVQYYEPLGEEGAKEWKQKIAKMLNQIDPNFKLEEINSKFSLGQYQYPDEQGNTSGTWVVHILQTLVETHGQPFTVSNMALQALHNYIQAESLKQLEELSNDTPGKSAEPSIELSVAPADPGPATPKERGNVAIVPRNSAEEAAQLGLASQREASDIVVVPVNNLSPASLPAAVSVETIPSDVGSANMELVSSRAKDTQTFFASRTVVPPDHDPTRDSGTSALIDLIMEGKPLPAVSAGAASKAGDLVVGTVGEPAEDLTHKWNDEEVQRWMRWLNGLLDPTRNTALSASDLHAISGYQIFLYTDGKWEQHAFSGHDDDYRKFLGTYTEISEKFDLKTGELILAPAAEPVPAPVQDPPAQQAAAEEPVPPTSTPAM